MESTSSSARTEMPSSLCLALSMLVIAYQVWARRRGPNCAVRKLVVFYTLLIALFELSRSLVDIHPFVHMVRGLPSLDLCRPSAFVLLLFSRRPTPWCTMLCSENKAWCKSMMMLLSSHCPTVPPWASCCGYSAYGVWGNLSNCLTVLVPTQTV